MDSTSFRRLVVLVHRWLPGLAAGVVLGTAVGLFVPVSDKPSFDARAAVHLATGADPTRSDRSTRSVPSDIVDMLEAASLQGEVAAALSLPVQTVRDQVRVRPRANGNDVIDITARAESPEAASQLATTYAVRGAARITSDGRARMQAALGGLGRALETAQHDQARLAASAAALPKDSASHSVAVEQLQTLSRRINALDSNAQDLQTQAALAGPLATASSVLDLSQGGARLDRPLRGILGALAGLLLAAIAVGARSSLRGGLDGGVAGDDLDGLNVLAVVPRGARQTSGSGVVDSIAADRLASAVQVASRRHGLRVLAVTGAGSAVGTSSVTAALAQRLVRRGLAVVVVDTDLRTPAQHLLAGRGLAPGLSDAVRDERWPSDDNMFSGDPDSPRVVPAGRCDDPATLLGSPQFERIIGQLAATHDLVLLDVPAPDRAPEAGLVVGVADAAVLCAAVGRTSRSALLRLEAALAGTRLLGVVLVRTGARSLRVAPPQSADAPLTVLRSADLTPPIDASADQPAPAPAPAAYFPQTQEAAAPAAILEPGAWPQTVPWLDENAARTTPISAGEARS